MNPPQTIVEAMERNQLAQFKSHFAHRALHFESDVRLARTEGGLKPTVEGIASSDSFKAGICFSGIRFVGCSFPTSVTFADCEFAECQILGDQLFFVSCGVLNSTLSIGQLKCSESCTFVNVEFRPKTTITFDCATAAFVGCHFLSHNISGSRCQEVTFFNCEFFAEMVQEVAFLKCTFAGTWFTCNTRFLRCKWSEIEIDRIFIDSLGKDRGGIADPTLRLFVRNDPIAELRMFFSGWFSVIHVASILLFLTPYAAFMVWKCIQTLVVSRTFGLQAEISDDFEPLWRAFLHHVTWGYSNETPIVLVLLNWPTFLAFLFLHICRFSLWVKARTLEHRLEVDGIWPAFELDEFVRLPWINWQVRAPFRSQPVSWMQLMKIVRYGTGLTLAIGLLHFSKILLFPVLRVK